MFSFGHLFSSATTEILPPSHRYLLYTTISTIQATSFHSNYILTPPLFPRILPLGTCFLSPYRSRYYNSCHSPSPTTMLPRPPPLSCSFKFLELSSCGYKIPFANLLFTTTTPLLVPSRPYLLPAATSHPMVNILPRNLSPYASFLSQATIYLWLRLSHHHHATSSLLRYSLLVVTTHFLPIIPFLQPLHFFRHNSPTIFLLPATSFICKLSLSASSLSAATIIFWLPRFCNHRIILSLVASFSLSLFGICCYSFKKHEFETLICVSWCLTEMAHISHISHL